MENTDVAKLCSAGHKNYWRCRISCACKGPEGTLISWFSLLSASISLSARSIVPKYSTNHITLWLKNLSLSCMTCLFENLYTDITLGSQAPHQHTPIAQLTQKPSGSREARETLSRQDPSINIQIITGKKILCWSNKIKLWATVNLLGHTQHPRQTIVSSAPKCCLPFSLLFLSSFPQWSM